MDSKVKKINNSTIINKSTNHAAAFSIIWKYVQYADNNNTSSYADENIENIIITLEYESLI